ncbi:hypothetical protein LEP1GSC026_2977 [Leptospira interrogans str. 2002000623]|nr:hypothetical protein LEP1GSC026_2977 [Leptospira interrogans str. 2002000623]EMO37796.1 hypothetical protein LEP1GSC177_2823 [Leptospira interrogans str. MMD3731]
MWFALLRGEAFAFCNTSKKRESVSSCLWGLESRFTVVNKI